MKIEESIVFNKLCQEINAQKDEIGRLRAEVQLLKRERNNFALESDELREINLSLSSKGQRAIKAIVTMNVMEMSKIRDEYQQEDV